MTKDYIAIQEETLNILGHKVKAIRERFSDKYLDSDCFETRCLRCCFYNEQELLNHKPTICNFIRCNGYSRDDQTHFELIK